MKYEVFEYSDLGYKTLMHFNDWRVAILNYIEDCHVDHLIYLEAHHKTDEVFVLLDGEATLIFADIADDNIINIKSVKLEKNKVYNIKKDVYHTQILSDDAKLLIVEQKDTGDSNSSKFYLNKDHLKLIKEAL